MRILITDLSPGQTYGFRFRSYNGDGYSDWSQIFRYRTTGDLVAPAKVEDLTWEVIGSSFVASWSRVFLDENGKRMDDFRDYLVEISDGLTTLTYYQSSENFIFTADENQSKFGSIRSTLTITVRGRDYTGNLADPVSLEATDPIPPVPSTPIVTVYLGNLVVEWNGKSANGLNMPYNFESVEVHLSTESNFTPSEATLNQHFYGKSQVPISDLEYGKTYYVRLVAKNNLQRSSDPSEQASGVPARISGLDIADGQISVEQINFADQLGGIKAYYQSTAPVGAVVDDLWYNTSKQNEVSRWDGSTWVLAPEVGLISGTKIIAGTLTANAVGTNLIIASKANIADGVIDDAKISNLNAGKITAGFMSSAFKVTYGGVVQPAWTIDLAGSATFAEANILGQVVIGNSSTYAVTNNSNVMLRSYNYLPNAAGWAIKGDGTVEFANGTFRGNITGATISGGTISGATISAGTTLTSPNISGGTISAAVITGGTFQTSSAAYPKITLDSSGLRLQNSVGSTTVNISTSLGTATITGIFKSNFSGRRVEINSQFTRPDSPDSAQNISGYSGIRIFSSSDTYFGEIGVSEEIDYSTMQMISPGAGYSNGSFLRLKGSKASGVGEEANAAHLASSSLINLTSAGAINITGNVGLNIKSSGNSYTELGGESIVRSYKRHIWYADTDNATNLFDAYAYWVAGYGVVSIGRLERGVGSVGLRMRSGNDGIAINSVNGVFAVRTYNDAIPADISAGNIYSSGQVFTASDINMKSNIEAVSNKKMLEEALSMQVYEYDMENSGRNRGIIAQEAPDIIKRDADPDVADDHARVDVYGMSVTTLGAVSALYDIIEELKQEIVTLKENANG
jgi:hypothetical protein